jgi:hypothetical protein
MKQLVKEHGNVSILQNVGSQSFEINENYNNQWQKVGNMFVSESYLDLTGLSMREKTVFFEAMTVQTGYPPLIMNAAATSNFIVFDYMTSIPLDLEQFTLSSLNYIQGIGWPVDDGQLNFENVHYGRTQFYAVDVDFGFYIPRLTSTHQHGSLGSTASDRVYSYRFLLANVIPLDPTQSSTVTLPPSRHLVLANVKEEAEYAYLMRLKRSYDLQQKADRD